MAVAYLILAHDAPHRVLRLVDRLWTPDATFVIHVDRKAGVDVMQKIFFGLAGRDNAILTERRFPVVRFGFDMVRAELECLTTLERLARPYTHAVLLSTTHYPLKPAEEIARTLERLGGESLLFHEALSPGKRRRVDRFHFVKGGIHVQVGNGRAPPRGVEVRTGSQWFCLSRAAVAEVLRMTRARGDLVRFFRFTDCPDEMFFQTLLASGPLSQTLRHEHVTWERWRPAMDRPDTLGDDDFPLLAASSALFARKVFPESGGLADRIDRELLGR